MNLWDLLIPAPFFIAALMAHLGHNFTDPKFYEQREENQK